MPEYRLGVPHGGVWKEILNSDAKEFGGSGVLNGDLKAVKKGEHGKDYSVGIKLVPLSVVVFEGEVQKKKGMKKAPTKALPAKVKKP
jgi:1,4-alpha-glucan branching enzyme